MLGLCPIISMRWKFKQTFPKENIHKNENQFTQKYIDWFKCLKKNSDMTRHEIIEDIQDIQLKVDEMGFMGSNEIDLWRSEMIADYIISKHIMK